MKGYNTWGRRRRSQRKTKNKQKENISCDTTSPLALLDHLVHSCASPASPATPTRVSAVDPPGVCQTSINTSILPESSQNPPSFSRPPSLPKRNSLSLHSALRSNVWKAAVKLGCGWWGGCCYGLLVGVDEYRVLGVVVVVVFSVPNVCMAFVSARDGS